MNKGGLKLNRQPLAEKKEEQSSFSEPSSQSLQHSQSFSKSNDFDEAFEPQFYSMKKLRIPVSRKTNKGAWSVQENKIYYNFLLKNKPSFINQTIRREARVFCRLSQALHRKRTPDQCRSHHQKFIGVQGEQIDCLIIRLKQKIDESEQDLLNNRRTRIIGKLKWKRQNAMMKREQRVIKEINEDQGQIRKVEQGKNYTIITFKNSNHMKVFIKQADIQTYNL